MKQLTLSSKLSEHSFSLDIGIFWDKVETYMIENLGSMYFDRSNWKTALSYLTIYQFFEKTDVLFNLEKEDQIHSKTLDSDLVLTNSSIHQKFPDITIFASTKTLEQQQKFQKIFIPTINAILKDYNNFYATELNKGYYPSDASSIQTNLTFEIFSKYYLHSTFNNSLDFKPTVIKTNKI